MKETGREGKKHDEDCECFECEDKAYIKAEPSKFVGGNLKKDDNEKTAELPDESNEADRKLVCPNCRSQHTKFKDGGAMAPEWWECEACLCVWCADSTFDIISKVRAEKDKEMQNCSKLLKWWLDTDDNGHFEVSKNIDVGDVFVILQELKKHGRDVISLIENEVQAKSDDEWKRRLEESNQEWTQICDKVVGQEKAKLKKELLDEIEAEHTKHISTDCRLPQIDELCEVCHILEEFRKRLDHV